MFSSAVLSGAGFFVAFGCEVALGGLGGTGVGGGGTGNGGVGSGGCTCGGLGGAAGGGGAIEGAGDGVGRRHRGRRGRQWRCRWPAVAAVAAAEAAEAVGASSIGCGFGGCLRLRCGRHAGSRSPAPGPPLAPAHGSRTAAVPSNTIATVGLRRLVGGLAGWQADQQHEQDSDVDRGGDDRAAPQAQD